MSPTYWLFGTHLTILADEQQTSSHYDLIEGRFPVGTQIPLHLHAHYDESIYVLEGAFTLFTDTQIVTLRPGEQVLIPKNTPHVVVASEQTVNRALTVASPSGFGKLIRTVGIPGTSDNLPPDTPNDMGLFLQLSQETGDVILGAPGARPVLKNWSGKITN
jgi:mannose-6-phosphate isomerase-like protein (cupin superfamily)